MRRTLPIKTALAVALAASLLLAACQSGGRPSPYVKDGKLYGVTPGTFNARWWNYYQRGLSFADGEFWKEAESDFLAALDQNARDERRTQTYGMHFIEYFPHRELGVVYYRQGRLAEAERELARSLEEEDTAKAHYFLAQARGRLLQQSGEDRMAPRVVLDGGDTQYAASPAFTLRGTLEDDYGVGAYAVDDASYYVRAPGPRITLQVRLSLREPRTRVRIRAVDLAGNAAIHECTVVLDQTGPFLVIDAKTRGAAGWEISGRASDQQSPLDLSWKNGLIPVREGRFSVRTSDTTSPVVITARDQAGNTTELVVALEGDGSSAPPATGVRIGSLATGTLLAAAETAEHASIRLVRQPPARVSTEYLTLHLDLTCESRITRVSVAGEPILGLPAARSLTFSHTVELKEGANTIPIEMETSQGTRVSQTVAVQRTDAQKPLRLERLRLAFYELSPAEESDTPLPLCQSFNRTFEFQLSERGRFSILARKELEAVLLERKLNIGGLADPRYAPRLAELAIADEVVGGSIRVRSDGIVAETRLVDVRTGEVDAAADVFHENTDPRTLDMLARALAIELENRFPLVRGKVVETNDGGAAFVLDKGGNDGLRDGLPVVVFEVKEFDTLIVGRAHLDGVKESRSRARLEDPAAAGSIQAGLEVMTR